MKKLFFFILFAINKCFAYDSNIHVYGVVKDNICVVSPSSKNLDVNLGDHSFKSFHNVGDGSNYIPFSIVLSSCGSGVSNVSIQFEGTPDKYNNKVLAIEQGTDKADNVGIQIVDNKKVEIPINMPSKQYKIDPNNDNELLFFARILVTSMPIKYGLVESQAKFVLTFD
ncbi:fimbrial protein [Photobacterium damselae]|uniref:fimbrial protein n=1 Tax=Photobacterium damselae TaxID=38293 RepID=UPI0040683B11